MFSARPAPERSAQAAAWGASGRPGGSFARGVIGGRDTGRSRDDGVARCPRPGVGFRRVRGRPVPGVRRVRCAVAGHARVVRQRLRPGLLGGLASVRGGFGRARPRRETPARVHVGVAVAGRRARGVLDRVHRGGGLLDVLDGAHDVVARVPLVPPPGARRAQRAGGHDRQLLAGGRRLPRVRGHLGRRDAAKRRRNPSVPGFSAGGRGGRAGGCARGVPRGEAGGVRGEAGGEVA